MIYIILAGKNKDPIDSNSLLILLLILSKYRCRCSGVSADAVLFKVSDPVVVRSRLPVGDPVEIPIKIPPMW
jgi:hypothetical protein